MPVKSRKSKPTSKKAIEKIARKEIMKVQELKSVFSELDEIPNASQASTTLTCLSLIGRGNDGNQRVGNQVQPVSFSLHGWFRPRGLKSGTGDQFDSAFYSRIIIVRQKPQMRMVSGTPAEIQIGSSEFFRKAGGHTGGQTNDFKDIFYKFNHQLGTVIYDKKFFVSGSENQNNTREIKFNYRFPKSARMNFTDNSAYPHEMITMFIINRKADDDTDVDPKTVEYSGHVELYYRDS